MRRERRERPGGYRGVFIYFSRLFVYLETIKGCLTSGGGITVPLTSRFRNADASSSFAPLKQGRGIECCEIALLASRSFAPSFVSAVPQIVFRSFDYLGLAESAKRVVSVLWLERAIIRCCQRKWPVSNFDMVWWRFVFVHCVKDCETMETFFVTPA